MSRRWPFAALAAAAMSVCVLAVVLGAADLIAGDARATLEGWRAAGRTGDAAEWNRLGDQLLAARNVDPRDAAHRASIAETLTWWLLVALPGAGVRERLVETALIEQRAALGRRPTWAMAWARLAELRHLEGAAAGAVMALVERAFELGPYEPGVHLVAVRVGLGLWADLDPERRALVERAVRRSLASGSNRDAFAVIALHYGRADWLASLSSDPGYHESLARMQRRAGG